MKKSIISGLFGGFIASFFAVYVDSLISSAAAGATIFIGTLIAGTVSGFDKGIKPKLVGFATFYVFSIAGLIIHTALFSSNAALAIIALGIFAPIIIVLYFASGFIVSRILKKLEKAE